MTLAPKNGTISWKPPIGQSDCSIFSTYIHPQLKNINQFTIQISLECITYFEMLVCWNDGWQKKKRTGRQKEKKMALGTLELRKKKHINNRISVTVALLTSIYIQLMVDYLEIVNWNYNQSQMKLKWAGRWCTCSLQVELSELNESGADAARYIFITNWTNQHNSIDSIRLITIILWILTFMNGIFMNPDSSAIK